MRSGIEELDLRCRRRSRRIVWDERHANAVIDAEAPGDLILDEALTACVRTTDAHRVRLDHGDRPDESPRLRTSGSASSETETGNDDADQHGPSVLRSTAHVDETTPSRRRLHLPLIAMIASADSGRSAHLVDRGPETR